MSVQSVEIKDTCRTWRAKDGSSYYVTLSHVCRDGRIGTGVGKPLVGLPPAFGLGRNYCDFFQRLVLGLGLDWCKFVKNGKTLGQFFDLLYMCSQILIDLLTHAWGGFTLNWM